MWQRAVGTSAGQRARGCVAPSPPTPLPLRGRGGISWQFSVAVCFFFASSRELNSPDSRTARCGSGHEGVLPPHPRPLSGCGGEGGLVASFQFSILSSQLAVVVCFSLCGSA